MIIYATGYSGDKTPRGVRKAERLKEIAVELNALIFDIRINPWSMAPCWRKASMEAYFGDLYVHVPELGNRNYKGEFGQGFMIADMAAGIRRILDVVNSGRSVILLCACETAYVKWPNGTIDPHCHRYAVAQAIGKHPDIEDVVEIKIWGRRKDLH